jgi:Leucine rich repeat/Leucine rich repeat N-terminal domain
MHRILSLLIALFLSILFAPTLPVQSATPTEFDCGTVSEINADECKALLALYTSVNGANWTNQAGWATTATPCAWFGVLCAGGHVVELRLPNNALSGDVPTNFGTLPFLLVLDLSDNAITSLPAKIGEMTQLLVLGLRGNRLTTITSKIGKLTQLVELDLSGNGLTAFPGESSNLVNLLKLHLNHNALVKLPAEIGNLIKLQELNLHQNNLAQLPAEVGTLTKLLALRLHNNRLTTIPAEISHLHKLQEFTLQNNQLTALPLEVAKLNELRIFTLSNNPGLTGALPDGWRDFTLMTTFWFDQTNLCEPQTPPFQSWLQGIANVKRSGLLCLYTYTAAFTVTTPGQLFTLIGTNFSQAQPLQLRVNGVNVGIIQSDEEGNFTVVLDSGALPPGFYLAMITDYREGAQLTIQPGAQTGVPTLTLPSTVQWADTLFLPVVKR